MGPSSIHKNAKHNMLPKNVVCIYVCPKNTYIVMYKIQHYMLDIATLQPTLFVYIYVCVCYIFI